MALQRARLQFKRDYPQEKGIDEFQSRALLDAMADTSRGPIGTRVLGPAQFELDKLAKKLLKAKEKNKPLVLTDDGKVFVTKKAAKKLVSSILAGPAGPSAAPAVQALIVPPIQAPDVPGMFEFTGKEPSKRTRSQTKRLGQLSLAQQRALGFQQQEDIDAARKKRKREEAQAKETREPRQADQDKETAQERELRSIKSQLDKDMDPADRMRLVQRMKAIRQQQNDGEQVDMTPYDEPDTPLTLTPAQETQVLRIVNKFATEMQTESDARIMAEAGIKAIKAAPPVVQHAAAKALSKLPEVVPSAETVKFQNALDDLAQIAAEDRRIQLDAEEARQYGRFRPTSEQQLANQRASEQIAAQLQQERDEEPVVFQPRPDARQAPKAPPSSPKMTQPAVSGRQGPRDYLLEPFTPQEQAAADIVNAAAKRNKAMKALQAQKEAATAIQAALRGRQGRRATSDRIQDLQLEVTRREIADQAVREMAAEAALSAQRDASARAAQSAVRGFLARRKAEKIRQEDERADRDFNIQDLANLADDTAALSRQERLSRAEDATKALQAAVRSKLTRDAMQKAIDRQDAEDAAVKTLQAAVRSKLTRDAMQKALDLQEKRIPPRPPSAPGITQPAIRYEDIFEEADFTDEFAREDDAARQLQAALRRFGDRSRFAKAREIEAEYAAQDAAAERGDIVVPGANIRPDTRVVSARDPFIQGWAETFPSANIPVPPPPPPLPIRYAEPVPKRTRASASVKRLEKAAAETGQSIPVMNFVNDLVADTLRQVVDEEVASKAQARIDAQDLQEQRSRLRPASERKVAETVARAVVQSAFDKALQDKFANTRQAEDEDTDFEGTGLVGGVLKRLRGMGYFNTMDITPTRVYGTPMDNKKLLAEAKAAYAARGGTFDGRTDFRVLMDAMKTLPRRQGGAMGGSVVLSGVPSPITGSGKYTLQAVTFPETDWKSSSSLRWLRSNGIKPIKKADRQGSLFRYRIVDPKGFNDYYTSELMSRGRKINLVYGSP
jgi:hypothetical protein